MNVLCRKNLGFRHPPNVAVLQICFDGRPLIEVYFVGQNDVVGSVSRISETVCLVEMFKCAKEFRLI